MAEELANLVRVGPAIWPGADLELQPGDLSKFVPQGLGLNVPLMMMPWDTLEAACERTSYYDFDRPSTHPIKAAPSAESAGGIVYFDPPAEADFAALLRILEIRGHLEEYAVFIEHSQNTIEDRYLTQLRIVSTFALASLFRASIGDANQAYIKQPLKVSDLLWKFITQQQAYWGAGYSHELCGTLGGDGDWAKESLAFGFMVENTYQCVYRIWSRPWLVTK